MKTQSSQLLFGHPVQRIHCLGAGGMGMAPLAIYLKGLGYSVSGEDDAWRTEVVELLQRAGVNVGEQQGGCDLLVISSAIKGDHPELQAFREREIKMVRRGELLAELAKEKRLVAIAGSHGKTTTTAMLIEVLRRSHFGVDYVLGGLFADASLLPAKSAGSDWLIAEVDESDGTIEGFEPEITVVVNLDWDHADHYESPEAMWRTFGGLIERTKGAALVSAACPTSSALLSSLEAGKKRVVTFGESGDFQSSINGRRGLKLELELAGRFSIQRAVVNAVGQFNAQNATAALATAELLGAQPDELALADFRGVRRRQAVLSETGGIRVLEDYAHHPTEIGALLESLRESMTGAGRLITVFQPHRHSRTAQFADEFARVLQSADIVLLMEVYSAGEAPVKGGTGTAVWEACERVNPEIEGRFVGEDEHALFASLDATVQEGDLVAFVGAGSIDSTARAWVTHRVSRYWETMADAFRSVMMDGTPVKREEPLATKTTMRVGGAARIYAEPESKADLQLLLREAGKHGVPVHFLGRGSNLIIADEGVDGLVISLAKPVWSNFEVRDGGRVRVGAGLRLKNLCGLAAKVGLVGFEFLEGIPGNVGGALRMNAGAMGGWMFDVVEEVELMGMDGEIKIVPKSEMHVVYRCCEELREAIALGAVLRPSASADTESVSRQIDVYRRKRQESQPREPSAGCIFKNPEGFSAGQLIDENGLKGMSIGGAEVSPVHGNFIVNKNKASGSDVIDLVRRVRDEIQRKQGVTMEPEAQLWGRRWEDVL